MMEYPVHFMEHRRWEKPRHSAASPAAAAYPGCRAPMREPDGP